MATLNFISGSFTGKVGEHVGAKWRDKKTIRARQFSKAPATMLQTKSVRAFECLNRFASGISKAGFKYLGLKAKNMHNHNAVARWLKPLIANNEFIVERLENIITSSNNIWVKSFVYSHTTWQISLSIDKSPSYIPPPSQMMFVLIFQDNGLVFSKYCLKTSQFSDIIQLPPHTQERFSLCIFTATPSKRGVVFENLVLKRGFGMRYSFEEQPTGDIWLDGRPIYVKTWKMTIPLTATTEAFNNSTGIFDVSHLVKAEINEILNLTNNQQNIGRIPVAAIRPDAQRAVVLRPYVSRINNHLQFVVSLSVDQYAQDYRGSDIIATFYYTKLSDPPSP